MDGQVVPPSPGSRMARLSKVHHVSAECCLSRPGREPCALKLGRKSGELKLSRWPQLNSAKSWSGADRILASRPALSCLAGLSGAERVVRECPPQVCKLKQSDRLALGKTETWRETRLRISGNGSELGMLRGEMAGSDPGPTHPGPAAGQCVMGELGIGPGFSCSCR
jgi:hypothetical protein